MLDDLNVSLILLNDIEMKGQHHDLFVLIVIHHPETLFDVGDDENASIEKNLQAQEKEKEQEKI